jgi:isopenicillin N synthase-like dioxygenase
LELPGQCQKVAARAFAAFRQVLTGIDNGSLHETEFQQILPDADSAHCNGYHSFGGLSRYNQHRRGFVFSDTCHSCAIESVSDFDPAVQDLFELLYSIFQQVLQALAVALELPSPDWFESHFGPTIDGCQWHLKEYKDVAGAQSEDCLLNPHTDPSLISVVIHDRVGVQWDGQGLEYAARDGQWRKVDRTGHGVAVLFLGSVWNVLHPRGGACRHKVVPTFCNDSSESTGTRVAATLFGRPAASARLVPLPGHARKTTSILTFEEWNQRVARRYQKNQAR